MNDIVKSIEDKVFAESQIVAKRFNKEHPDFCRKVENLIDDLTLQKFRVKDYFVKSSFTNDRNRVYKNYLMTRDGFSLAVMSLTGGEALKFKVQFIEAFNMMEANIKDRSIVRLAGKDVRKTLCESVDTSGENERMHGHGYTNYTKLAYSMVGIKYKKGVTNRDDLSRDDLERLKNVETMIRSLIESGKIYKDIKEITTFIFSDDLKRLK